MASSSGSGPSFQELVTVGLRYNNVWFAFLAIVIYEWVTNIDREVALFSRKRWSLSFVILSTIRFFTVVHILFVFLPNRQPTCQSFGVIKEISYIVLCLAVALFGALRVYALAPVNGAKIATLILVLSGISQVFNVITLIRTSYIYSGVQCNQSAAFSPHTTAIFSWIAGPCAFVANLLILLVTWKKTFTLWNECRKLRKREPTFMEPSIAQYILRDGTIYFVLVAGLEFTNIISFSVGEKDQLSMVYFQPALQVAHGLIICRFILNLQKHNEQNSGRCMDSNASIRAGTVVLNQNCNRMDDIGGFLDWTGLNELDELDAEDDYLAGDLLDNLTRTSTNGLVMDSAEIQVVLRSSTST